MMRPTALLLLQLTGMVMMMIGSGDAIRCYKCSSLTDDGCAVFNATLFNGRCTGTTCFETYDATKPGS